MRKQITYGVLIIITLFFFVSCSLEHRDSLELSKYDEEKTFNEEQFDEKYKPNEITSIMHESQISSGIQLTTYATSRTSEIQKQYSTNLVIENKLEPIYLSILQRGKDRKMRLLVYLDYVAQKFTVADGEAQIYYDIDMKNNEELIMPISIDMDSISEDESHRLIFVIVPSPEQYAKDKKNITLKPSFTEMYQLYIGKYDESIVCHKPNNIVALEDTICYNHKSLKVTLNTDISNIDSDRFDGLKLPEKNYKLKKGSKFEMNCIITNISEPVDEAIVFLTLDNKPIDINGNDFILMNLNKKSMNVSKISFDIKNIECVEDVIAYVVYSPFENMIMGEQAFAYPSARFSIETIK